MLRYPLLIGLILLALVVPAKAQTPQQIYSEGVDSLYNLEFDLAEKHFRLLTEIEPENPANWNQLASALWLRIVARQEKLNLESFSGASLGRDDSTDIIEAQEEKQLRETISLAITTSDALLRRNPRDVEALYAKGAAKAQLAVFEALAKRAYFAAYKAAREANDLHREVLKQDPGNRDAELTIGIYDYTISSIPGWFRFFLGVFGVRGGDKERGLSTVADVARNGKRTATDAKILLVVMYNREKRYGESLALLTELQSRYPRNYLFELSRASIHSRLLQWEDAMHGYNSVLRKIDAGAKGYNNLNRAGVLLLLAKTHLDSSEVTEAMDIYMDVVSDLRSTDTDRANARLWLGRLYDLMKERTNAVAQYDAILSLNCDPRLKAEARRYKREPFGLNGKF